MKKGKKTDWAIYYKCKGAHSETEVYYPFVYFTSIESFLNSMFKIMPYLETYDFIPSSSKILSLGLEPEELEALFE